MNRFISLAVLGVIFVFATPSISDAGHVDGMSLYRAYYVPTNVDPGGNQLKLIFNPNTHVGAPWGLKNFSTNIYGETAREITIECACELCEIPLCHQDYQVKGCTETVKQFILIDYNQLGPEHDLDGTYGHEQMHVRNRIRNMQLIVPDLYKDVLKNFNIPTACESQEQCERRSENIVRTFNLWLTNDLMELWLVTEVITLTKLLMDFLNTASQTQVMAEFP